MMKWFISLLLCGLMSWPQPAPAQNKAAPQFTPETTTVAIVPVVNAGGEKNEEFRTRQTESGNTELAKEFTAHGFKLIDQAAITKAMTELKVDLSDEEQQKRDNLYKIGKAVNAELVVFVVITDTAQQFHVGVFNSSREGRAKIKMWLLDVKNEVSLLSAVTKEGKSGGGFFSGLDVGSKRIVIAVANGERDALANFFKPYPQNRKDQK